ncbi:aminodeoxychorismate lyase [Colletotrichum plurivorum]|uniref:Aminodeoxychorismate lyase n=1 Tax=Colletotrichum plurivorum TaxID=2175906 RepID=A0A8H6K6G1_9PEZI|nr:aminodeoxychorismate lyase [Colletotrichum plurivorum]
MVSNDDVEAVTSDPSFEIITTLAYSAGLPVNEASLPFPHCYLLQHAIDRLRAAALDLSWTSVVQDLSRSDRLQSLSKEVDAHMTSAHGDASQDPSRRFIVRLAFKKDGILSIMSGPRPSSTDPLHPTTLSNDPPACEVMPVYFDTQPTTPSLFTRHKTTYRVPYNAAWERAGLDEETSTAECDVLLQNGDGHVMGAVFRTVYFYRKGSFVTPSEGTGCKIGVSRRWALENVGVEQALIAAADVEDGEVVWLSSAVGGFIRGRVTLGGRKGAR